MGRPKKYTNTLMLDSFKESDIKVYSLFSGGKDSFATAKYLQEQDRLAAVVLLDTGISVPNWEETTREIAEKQGFNVEVYKTPIRYEWLVWKYGFPGAGFHQLAMTYLKGRGVVEFRKAHPESVLASGVRMSESSRRAINTKEWSHFEGVPVWAPIYDWSTEKVVQYNKQFEYSKPRSYITLGVSGDCLCGAYAMSHEREALSTHYPAIDERIVKLERMCRDRFTGKKCSWGWSNQQKRKTLEEELICVECKREVV